MRFSYFNSVKIPEHYPKDIDIVRGKSPPGTDTSNDTLCRTSVVSSSCPSMCVAGSRMSLLLRLPWKSCQWVMVLLLPNAPSSHRFSCDMDLKTAISFVQRESGSHGTVCAGSLIGIAADVEVSLSSDGDDNGTLSCTSSRSCSYTAYEQDLDSSKPHHGSVVQVSLSLPIQFPTINGNRSWIRPRS